MSLESVGSNKIPDRLKSILDRGAALLSAREDCLLLVDCDSGNDFCDRVRVSK